MLKDLDGRHEKVRVPNSEWFNLYRKAKREVPDVVDAMYALIAEHVRLCPAETHFNSTQLGGLILNSEWSHKSQWNDRYGGATTVSSGLFGQIMWTFFFDDSKLWTWTKTGNNIDEDQEREYFRQP